MFQVGDLVRCLIDGEMGIVLEKKLFKYYDDGSQYWHKICWQGSELRSEMGDQDIDWNGPSEIVSIEEYDRIQEDEESS